MDVNYTGPSLRNARHGTETHIETTIKHICLHVNHNILDLGDRNMTGNPEEAFRLQALAVRGEARAHRINLYGF